MALKVTKDTFLYERVNPHGQTVRRQVFAGQTVPPTFEVGEDTDEGAVEEVEAVRGPGLGSGPHGAGYNHQRGTSVEDQLKARLGRDPSEEEIAAATFGGQAQADLEQSQQSERSGRRSGRRSRAGHDDE